MGYCSCNRGWILLLLILPVSVTECTFKFEDCSKEDGIVQVSVFRVSPDPIDMKKSMSVTARGELINRVPPGAMLETKYYRLRSVFGLQMDFPIPCLFGKYGSCTLPFCDYLERFKTQICPFFSNELHCGCPVLAGIYGGENVEIEMTDLTAVGRFIAKVKNSFEVSPLTNALCTNIIRA
ncbi:hypothetical protein X975_15888, partial [Stegodyphus mimosarum]